MTWHRHSSFTNPASMGLTTSTSLRLTIPQSATNRPAGGSAERAANWAYQSLSSEASSSDYSPGKRPMATAGCHRVFVCPLELPVGGKMAAVRGHRVTTSASHYPKACPHFGRRLTPNSGCHRKVFRASS